MKDIIVICIIIIYVILLLVLLLLELTSELEFFIFHKIFSVNLL